MADNVEHFSKISVVSSGFRCEIDLSRFGRQFTLAQQWLGDRILEDCKPFMPLETGNFQQRSMVLEHGRKVLFPGPFGRFLYMGKVMVDPDTGSPWARKGAVKVVTDRALSYSQPNATSFWFDAAKAANGEYWLSEVKRIGGGR